MVSQILDYVDRDSVVLIFFSGSSFVFASFTQVLWVSKDSRLTVTSIELFFKGGLKAVVWTDVVQTFSMFGALILVAIKGTIDLREGGVEAVLRDAYETKRLEAPMYDLFLEWTSLRTSIF